MRLVARAAVVLLCAIGIPIFAAIKLACELLILPLAAVRALADKALNTIAW